MPNEAAALRIQLLGGFRVTVGQREIVARNWRRRKAAALVKLLALAPGHRLSREHLMDTLWSDFSLESAANNFHQSLHVARRVLEPDRTRLAGPSSYLLADGDFLSLASPDSPWVDVDEFERAHTQALHQMDVASIQHALALYTGELLPDDRYEEWATGPHDRLRDLYVELLVALVRAHERQHEYDLALDASQRVIATDPTSAEGHTGLIRALAFSGQRAEALRRYVRLREMLLTDLGVEPDDDTQQLYHDILAGNLRPSAIPTTPAPPTPPHNLPRALTSFIGRRDECAAVARLLADHQVVTLTGVAGSGKTRLALRVAEEVLPSFGDGAWLVDLSAVTAADRVARAAAAALGVRAPADRGIAEALVEALRRKRLLLILDNCEHILDDAAQLAGMLLAGCPGVRVLATSREALHIPGEVVWVVPTLLVPDLASAADPDTLRTNDAVRLFVERAHLQQPAFALASENAASVVRIVRQVEGIPLAIELAAARLTVLSAAEVADRLARTLHTLGDATARAPARQRTMRATIAWSYSLLGAADATAFRRFAAFPAAFNLAAAEAVCVGTDIEPEQVLDVLARLAGKSLLIAEPGTGGPTRYRLLEVLRQYGREQLARDEIARRDTYARLAAWSCDFAEGAAPHLIGPDQDQWHDRLEMELHTLRIALEWSAQDPATAVLGLRLSVALWRFWEARGYTREGSQWLDRLLDIASDVPPALLANALMAAGNLAQDLGLYALATELHTRCLAVHRERQHPRGIAIALTNLGVVAYSNGQFTQARGYYDEALALFRAEGDPWHIALILNNLGLVVFEQHDPATAGDLLDESLLLARQVDDKQSIARALDSLGSVARKRGEPTAALAFYRESLMLRRDIGDKDGIAWCLEGLAEAGAMLGQPERAARLFAAADTLRAAIGAPLPPVEQRTHDRMLSRVRQALGETAWMVARRAGQSWPLSQAIAAALASSDVARNGDVQG